MRKNPISTLKYRSRVEVESRIWNWQFPGLSFFSPLKTFIIEGTTLLSCQVPNKLLSPRLKDRGDVSRDAGSAMGNSGGKECHAWLTRVNVIRETWNSILNADRGFYCANRFVGKIRLWYEFWKWWYWRRLTILFVETLWIFS